MQSDLATLRERSFAAIKAASLPVEVEGIALESDKDDQGSEFLRVMVQVKPGTAPRDEDLEALLELVEATIGDIDERYPSVRFPDARSEEHTSELQSLMRISYAVFCLKKKNKNKINHTTKNSHITTTKQNTKKHKKNNK